MRGMRKPLAIRSTDRRAASTDAGETSGGLRLAPWVTWKPARCQAMVPSFRETTLLVTPALISDWAPMMLRVRPPQLTMTIVLGDGTRSLKRKTSSAPGTLTAVGIELL